MRARWFLALCGLLAALPALSQEHPGGGLLTAIAARDPAGVTAAFAAGARPELPAAEAVIQALAETPDEPTRATMRAFAEAAQAASFAPEAMIAGPAGASGSLATRLAALPGEEALFLDVARLTAPARRCQLLGQLIFGRDGTNFPAAAAMLPLIPPEQAATPACSLPFTMLANPARRPPPALVEAMLAAGLRPYPDVMAELIRQVPPGAEGDGAFRQLIALDLSAIATYMRHGARRRVAVLAQLGEEVLSARASRVESLLGRWGELVEAAPAELLCAVLPREAVHGWLSIEGETPWREVLRATTRSLLTRCPTLAFDAPLAEAAGDRLWTRLLDQDERPLIRLMLAAGLRPAEIPRLAGRFACAAEARLLQALIETGPPEEIRLMPRFMACLGGVEAPREGDMPTLALILAHESAVEPIEGDLPAAIAAGIDRPDIVEALVDHGAVRARLPAERQAFWRHRRLAALAGTERPRLPWEAGEARVPDAPELMSLAPGLGAWLIHGDCGNVNCGYSIAVRDGRGYRLVLEDTGLSFRLERAIGRRARDVTITARTSATTQAITTWRYDGRVYQRHRCRQRELSAEGSWEESSGRCAG